MSWLGKQLGSAKKLVTDPKDWIHGAADTVGKAATNPLVQAGLGFATGGAAIPALAGIGGGLIRPNSGNVLQNALKGGASGVAAGSLGAGAKGALAGFQNDGGLSGALSGFKSGTTGAINGLPGGSFLTRALGKAGGLVTGGGSDGQGNFGAIGDLVGKFGGQSGQGGSSSGGTAGAAGGALSGAMGGDGGGVNPLVLALAGLQGANAAALGKKSNDYAENAFRSVDDSYKARAGLRDQGIQGLMNPRSHDLSELTRIRAGLGSQPQATPMRLPQGGPRPILQEA